ncbi:MULTISPECIES: hypothetical protein [Pseudomonas]|uniref:hypothetical protein n=1 Tax=Pseudomonas TaxID=286 RepID=UPI0006D41BD8|nr:MULTISPECIES: hypothetical protein [Pseudomonas]
MGWYRTGTVAITSGSTTVTGTGTAFAANCRVGDEFKGPDGRGYEVVNVATDRVLSIAPAYQGPTVTAGTYSLVPIQGYPKDLTDRFKQIVESWGGSLALIGNATTSSQLLANIGAAKRGSNSDITELTGLTKAMTIAQGGTGATTAADARTALGLKSAALADVVGTVSAVGGAIIERGSNANGDYTKFADGTLEGWITSSNSQSIPNNSGIEISVTYPATFVGTPTITGSAGLATSGTTGLAARVAVGFPFAAPGLSSARVHIFNTTGITIGGFSYFIKIKGRWR